jgi:molecular chaperone GrpE
MADELDNQNLNNSDSVQDDGVKAAPEEKTEETELEKLQKKCEEYLDGWKRAKADFINYKKDELGRLAEMARFANEDMIRDLIVVLDSFDLGLITLEGKGIESKGFYMIRTQLEDALKKRGLERVIISVGSPFDPNLQEAIVEVESENPSGTVVEEVERGYTLNGKIIRPARVKVAR